MEYSVFVEKSKGPFLEFKAWFDELPEEEKEEAKGHAVARVREVLLDYFGSEETLNAYLDGFA